MTKSKLIEANEKIAQKVTETFEQIENTVVSNYTKIEDRFVNRYLIHENETLEEAKARLNQKQLKRYSHEFVYVSFYMNCRVDLSFDTGFLYFDKSFKDM